MGVPFTNYSFAYTEHNSRFDEMQPPINYIFEPQLWMNCNRVDLEWQKQDLEWQLH